MKPSLSRATRFLIRLRYGLLVAMFFLQIAIVHAAPTVDLQYPNSGYNNPSFATLVGGVYQTGTALARGATIRVSLAVKNAGTGASTPTSVEGMYLDYQAARFGSGGDTVPEYTIPFSPIPALLPGETATITGSWTVPMDAPMGKYWTRWIIDPLNQVAETNETNNASVNIFSQGPAGWDGFRAAPYIVSGVCDGATVTGEEVALDPDMDSGCVMPTTNVYATQSGACESGYSGNCALRCNLTYKGVYGVMVSDAPGGAWDMWSLPQPSGDVGSCVATPPSINTFELCTLDGSSCASSGATLTTDVGTPLRVSWSSTNTDLCTAVSGIGFSTGNAMSGTDTTGMFAGDSPLYRIACNIGGGMPSESTVYVSTNPILPTLSSSATIVKSGSSVRVSWNTNNGDETLCSLVGAGVATSDLLNGTGNIQDGYVDVSVNGRTTFSLTCPTGIALKTVEIIPTSWE